VTGELVPYVPREAGPFLGTTINCEPFHESEKFGAPLGHDCRNGPPFAVEVAQVVPDPGKPPLRAWYWSIAASSKLKSAWQAESCAWEAILAMLCGVVVVVGEALAEVPAGAGLCGPARTTVTITPRITTTTSMETIAMPCSVARRCGVLLLKSSPPFELAQITFAHRKFVTNPAQYSKSALSSENRRAVANVAEVLSSAKCEFPRALKRGKDRLSRCRSSYRRRRRRRISA
jgi:hypothetical protein